MKKRTLKYKLAELFPRDAGDDDSPESEEARVEENEAEIDNRLEKLAETLGRKLTAREEDEFLEIVDEYTPEDGHGKYLVSLIPFDYAWEIYRAKKDKLLKRFTVHVPEKK